MAKLTKSQQDLLDDMVGQVEIASMTGESRGVVSMWLSRAETNGFPEPVLTLGAGRFFLRSEVLKWHARRQPGNQNARKP